MSVQTFKATHCGQTFTGADGAKAFELHCKVAHRRHPYKPGQSTYHGGPAAPGWKDGEIERPYAWAPPKRSPGGIERVAERIRAGEYYWPVAYLFPAGVRWSTADVDGEVAS